MSDNHPESLIEQLHAESGLSRNQIRFWVGQRPDPGNPLYNTVFAFRITGKIQPETLVQAWQAVVDGYPVLRLRIREEAGRPYALTHPQGSCSLKTADFTSRSDPYGEFLKWSKGRAARALPLTGELVDAVLVRLGNNCHGLYLNQHHIITDAVSTIRLLELVFEFYNASGHTYRASRPPAGYLETIEAIQNAGKERLEAARIHFDNRRGDRFPPPEYWGRKAAGETTAIERLVLQLTPSESEGLRRISSMPPYSSFFQELSLLAVFSTILSTWLFHVSGQRSFRFDMPMAHRPTPDTRKALGLFIEMLPFSVEIENTDTFASLGKRCLAEVQALLKTCAPGSSFAEHFPASSAVLNYSPQPFKKVDGLEMESEWIHSGHSDSVHGFRLQVHDYNGTGSFTLCLDFNKACFSGTERERGTFIMRSILDAFLEDTKSCIGKVHTLLPFDKQAFLLDFNATGEIPSPTKTVVQHFHDQVARTPDRTALREGPKTLTYAELNKKVTALAANLSERNIGNGSVVPVFMWRSIDAVTGILAVLSTGAAYVPLDPEYPASRISHILRDCGASLVLTHRGLTEKLAEFEGEILDLDTATIEDGRKQVDASGLRQAAYMIYTSGSTGQPKGVPIDHVGLSDYLEWAARQYVRGDRLTFPLFTSLAFDLTVTCLFLPLITGGTLVVYEAGDGPVDSALIDVINDNQVDLIKLTPSHLSLLQQMDLSTSGIRRMILGGEDLKVFLAKAITRQFNQPVEIFNEYGPTEAVVGCMIHKFDPREDTDISVPIGVPADHVQLYVLNDSLNPVPPGVPGELCISRLGLTRGYHGRAELNAERFVAHPFREGEKLYRSGDLVRFNQRGLLEYLGRIDRQMKISGFRIEPGEIERCLADHPAVESCVVSSYEPAGRIHPDMDSVHEMPGSVGNDQSPLLANGGQVRIVAYCVTRNSLEESELRNYLSSRLPEALVPHRFIPIESIPLTPNGKTDFSALPHPDGESGADTVDFVEPSGPVEEQVAAIWEAVIGGRRLSADSNFFQAGGTSLAAMEAMLQICNAFEIDLPLQTIFKENTISLIAKRIEAVLLQEISELSDEEAQILAESNSAETD